MVDPDQDGLLRSYAPRNFSLFVIESVALQSKITMTACVYSATAA